MSGTKPKSCVWMYFTINNENKGICNFCSTCISRTAARFKHHLLRACLKCPQNVKSIIFMENNKKKIRDNSISFSSNELPLFELKTENDRLLKLVSNQENCIKLLENYRNYFILFCNTCKCGLNIGNKLILNELEKDYEKTFAEKNRTQMENNNNSNYDINTDNNFLLNREEILKTYSNRNRNTDINNILMIEFNENSVQSIDRNEDNITNSLVDIKTEDNLDPIVLPENTMDLNNFINRDSSDEQLSNNIVVNEEFVFGSNLFNDKKKAENVGNEFEFKCEIKNCGQKFKSKLGLESHTNRDHKNIKPFKCNNSECDKSFFTKNSLQKHLVRIHGKNRNIFKCNHKKCDRIFINRSELQFHLRSHTRYKPYICDWTECNARYKCMTSLKYHKLKHQDIESHE